MLQVSLYQNSIFVSVRKFFRRNYSSERHRLTSKTRALPAITSPAVTTPPSRDAVSTLLLRSNRTSSPLQTIKMGEKIQNSGILSSHHIPHHGNRGIRPS